MWNVDKSISTWFNELKVFGFIWETSGASIFTHLSIFTHISAIESPGFNTLTQGQMIKLTATKGLKRSPIGKYYCSVRNVRIQNGRRSINDSLV